jgi:hypothetical protein
MKMDRRSRLFTWLALLTAAAPLAACGDDDSATCPASTAECVDDSLARVCPADGAGWLAVPCAAGETCQEGACVTGEPTCTPGAVDCATSTIARICAADGSTWIPLACGDAEICDQGACVVDLAAGACTPGATRCDGDRALLTCSASGVGFASLACPGTTTCMEAAGSAACTGPVCAIGQGTCDGDGSGGTRCVDGTQYEAFRCGPDEVCLAGQAGPACVVPGCLPGQEQCGDPSDPAFPETAGFTRCDLRADGTLGWIRTLCAAPAGCVYDALAGQARCASDCVPGAQRCDDLRLGIQTCGAEGTWGEAVACSAPDEDPLFCVVLHDHPGRPVCAEPVCYLAEVYYQLGGVTSPAGVCEAGLIRECGADGRVSTGPAEACATGLCVPRFEALGQTLGFCTAQCQPGDQRCVAYGLEVQTCADNGIWELVPAACPADQYCFELQGAGDLVQAICGECRPGAGACVSDTTRVLCGEDAQWEPESGCPRGVCDEILDEGVTLALCVDECSPGEVVCLGTNKTASDGNHVGTAGFGTCTAQARLPTTVSPCPGTTTCRETFLQESLGCVECLGTAVPGGNEDGLADSRCATVGQAVQTCTAANDWTVPAVTCPTNHLCYAEAATGNAYCDPD